MQSLAHPGGTTGMAVVQAGEQGHSAADWDPRTENLFQADSSLLTQECVSPFLAISDIP